MKRAVHAANVLHNRHRPDANQGNKLMNAREGLMDNVRRYRALASLCRQQAAYRPLQSWELLGQAEHFEYLAEVELKAHFDACNAQRDEDGVEASAWERPAAA